MLTDTRLRLRSRSSRCATKREKENSGGRTSSDASSVSIASWIHGCLSREVSQAILIRRVILTGLEDISAETYA